MTFEQYVKNLEVPQSNIDVVLDTDAYNEVDDQFALAYLLKSPEKLSVKAVYAAPFFNENSSSPEDGMEKSYDEILKIIKLAGAALPDGCVLKGSRKYLQDEHTPVHSPAAQDLALRATGYSPQNPLYVVAIGAITNVASALLISPEIKENIVVVWLGGHALDFGNSNEFNMAQDVAAARVVFGCGVPLVQLPCMGVVDKFYLSEAELRYWIDGKNALCSYLTETVVEAAERYAKGRVWSRVIWDVTAVAWLLNDSNRFMSSRLIASPIPEYDHHYGFDPNRHFIRYVFELHRDALFEDLFAKLVK